MRCVFTIYPIHGIVLIMDIPHIQIIMPEGFFVKIAVIGSRNVTVPNLGDYLPENCTELVSGGAKGVDTSAREYAEANNIKLTEFLPDYKRYGRGAAPLRRND